MSACAQSRQPASGSAGLLVPRSADGAVDHRCDRIERPSSHTGRGPAKQRGERTVERHLREHFERAVDDDPGVAPDDMAHAAIIEGVRLRRRRNQLTAAAVAAGMVVVIGAVAGLNLPSGRSAADQPVTVAAAMMPVVAPSCTPRPVERDATDVVIFLGAEITDRQRAALETALSADPQVQNLIFESRGQAYERFRTRWAHNPDLVAAVTADQFPESFRLRLVAASQYTAVRSRYATMDGVEEVIGRRCPKDAPVGGLQ
ncbi:permease-like cell division protein FtsX [Micromonospora sp. MS34]|uniref:permease-like cell division protein FtsX n=1 Tax=Micromonospora sp. MS34 TaxID=3385971 RepID=UPI00399F18A5